MLDSKSKQKQENKSFKGQQSGQKVENRAQAERLDRSFAGKTLGYTRTGQAYLSQESKREYTY